MKHCDVTGCLGWPSDHAGRNASERRAGLETANVEADPPTNRGRLPPAREASDASTVGFHRGSGGSTHGRGGWSFDRIGSQNTQIQLVNYWPDISLDEYINLKERVENRMVIADVSATGDDNVLTSKSSDIAYRKEQLRRMQEEVIELEDVKAGISITDLGLNEFRMDLLNYVKEGDYVGKCRSPP